MNFTAFSNLKSYKGYEISFGDLIEKIRQGTDHILDARIAGKPSKNYQEIKETRIEVFQPNVRNFLQSRITRYNTRSTGYIFLDIDNFVTGDEAIAFKESICSRFNFISACWISLSGRGLSVLVRIDKCNRDLFYGYWDKLNEIFQGRIDRRTRCYDQLCCFSKDSDVFVNPEATYFDSLYKVAYRGLLFKEFLQDSEFDDVNQAVVYSDGHSIVELNLYKYKRLKKADGAISSVSGISVGKRNPTIALVSMLLIYLNPDADRAQLLNAVLSLNRYYCTVPLSYDEVVRIFNANFKKLSKLSRAEFSKLVEKYRVKRYVFFHQHCTLTKNEKLSIIQKKLNFLNGKGKEYTEQLIQEIIVTIKDGRPITRKRIMELTSLSESTVKRYWKPFKDEINNYNNSLVEETLERGSEVLNTLRGSNISSAEPPTSEEIQKGSGGLNVIEDPFQSSAEPDEEVLTIMAIDGVINYLRSKGNRIDIDTVVENSNFSRSTVEKHWREFAGIATLRL